MTTRLLKKTRRWIKPVIGLADSKHWTRYLRHLQGVTILSYHEVGEHPFEFFPEGLKTSVDRFREDMAFLKAHFKILHLDEAIRMLKTGTCREHAVVLTFDDGYSGVCRTAYPILKALEIPATLFLNGSFLTKKSVSSRVLAEFLLAGDEHENNRERRQNLMQMVRSPDAQDLQALQKQYASANGPATDGLHLDATALHSMDSSLIHIANHGWSHRWLAGLPESEQRAEIECGDACLREFAHYRPFFAAPFGTADCIDDTTVKVVREVYGTPILLLGGGINRFEESSRLSLRRDSISNNKPPLLELLCMNQLGRSLFKPKLHHANN